MKKFLIFSLLLIAGCTSYHPKEFVGKEPHLFWAARDDELCPVCGDISRYVRSYYGKDDFDTPFVYYYRCCPRSHLWVMIEQMGKVMAIKIIKGEKGDK